VARDDASHVVSATSFLYSARCIAGPAFRSMKTGLPPIQRRQPRRGLPSYRFAV